MGKGFERFGLARAPGPGFWETLADLLPGHRRPLDSLQVEITTRCPGRCTYCPHTRQADRWQTADMPPKTFGRLWPLLRRSRRVHLQGWGEPLLHADFFGMAALARRAGCAVSTTTCGLHLTEERARRLVESGLDMVAFSLTGTDAAGNAARRGVDFDGVVAAVETLQRVRRERQAVHLEIHFAYLLLASSMEAVAGLPALMARLGVHAAVVSTLDCVPAPDLSGEAFAPGDDARLSRAEAILRETAAEAQRLGVGFHWDLPGPRGGSRGCRENAGRSLFVAVDGSLAPCVFTRLPLAGEDPARLTFGNVNREDPLAIWESEPFRRFRAGLADGPADPRCQACPKRLG